MDRFVTVGGVDNRLACVESRYKFTTPDKLIADFQKDIARWNDENSDS